MVSDSTSCSNRIPRAFVLGGNRFVRRGLFVDCQKKKEKRREEKKQEDINQ